MIERFKQLKSYGILRIVNIAFCYLRTRLFYRPALFIFFPLDIRGKNHIRLGRNMTCGKGCRIEAYPIDEDKIILSIGENVQINDYVHIAAIKNVIIGNNVLMASRIYISDAIHGNYSSGETHSNPKSIIKERQLTHRKVIIEDNTWIGEGVCILPGVTIGRNSIIGANSVVTKSIAPNCIAVGNPANVIKTFNSTTRKWERSE